MNYCQHHTQEIYEELCNNEGLVNAYDDVLTGSAYLDTVCDGKIGMDDMLLIFSINGVQLYKSKLSDCWIYIWIILEHSPDEHYKKKHVLPGAIIPGPNKPKFIKLFLYPGFHHVLVVQREGLTIWDASIDCTFTSNLFLMLACGDGPGLLCLSNLVGHSGMQGCHMFCPIKGCQTPCSCQVWVQSWNSRISLECAEWWSW
ncbi:hypothetical protein BS17DRAFT_698603 [Gyrodon lividus]|nr:hypothetical protein BS17DRAFT_698603 [Gyrodon lividus]